jgi:hypothetical protein
MPKLIDNALIIQNDEGFFLTLGLSIKPFRRNLGVSPEWH